MKIDACFQLGHITGTYGLSGELHVFMDTDRPEYYQNLESVFVLQKGGETLIPFFISTFRLKGDKATIGFEDIISKDQAKMLVGSSLYLPLDQLPKLEGQEFYYHELLQWSVHDQNLGELGTITSINLQSPQPLIVMDYKGYEVLIPFTDEIVTGIDRARQAISVQLPEGLLDVYLNNS